MSEATLSYKSLNLDSADLIFRERGELFVVLEPVHAQVAISFIEMGRIAKQAINKKSSWLSRIRFFVGHLGLLFVIAFRHSRLLELTRIVLSDATNQSWLINQDGSYVFHFSR